LWVRQDVEQPVGMDQVRPGFLPLSRPQPAESGKAA
jgi:hypothetical protein